MTSPANSPSGPLHGLRILDLSTVVMGPYASQILADLGADVIKLEPPSGDQTRYYKPQRGTGMSGLFLSLHRNKRSAVLDLKTEEGREQLWRLAASCDVVLHNFRPKVAERLGAGYERLKAVNDRIIVCKAYGFGSGGADADKPAYDDVIQARSGLAAMFAKVQGTPQYVPAMICDKVVGQMIAIAILAACHQRAVRGIGAEVEVPMFESMVAFNLAENLASATFDPPLGEIGWARNVSPMRKPFRTLDGYVCLLPYSDRNWQDFLAYAGRPEIAADPRYATLADRALNIDDLYRIVEAFAATRSSAELLEFCERRDIPAAPVLAMEALWADPHLEQVGMLLSADHPTQGRYRLWRSPIRFAGHDWQLRHHAPQLGEHTQEVLEELEETGADKP
ncbi:CoA transferase [Pigmentiphaga soli]|uniref:CoA transferase n=1 Tax=Pigmentiphaga soli TaxID=1007095 RepID=A0ABP8GP60_9BURK